MKTNIISIKSTTIMSSLIKPRQNGEPSCRKGTFY